MGLPEIEKPRVADHVERRYTTTPKPATALDSKDRDRRRWLPTERGIIAGLAGLGLMLAGVALGNLALEVVGFLLMGGGTYWATLFMGDRPLRWKPGVLTPDIGAEKRK